MLEKQFRNYIIGLTGTELVSTSPVNIDSVAFYQTISSKISIQIFEKFEEDKRTARMSSLHLEGSNVRKMDIEAGR